MANFEVEEAKEGTEPGHLEALACDVDDAKADHPSGSKQTRSKDHHASGEDSRKAGVKLPSHAKQNAKNAANCGGKPVINSGTLQNNRKKNNSLKV